MTHLTFLIPVRHPENVRDAALARTLLAETFASISAQDVDGWKAIVIANRGADLPPLPANFGVEWVDFPPNALHDRRLDDYLASKDASRLDKGRRLLAGLLAARDSTYVMPVDDDDFVSRRISGFVKENSKEHGWYIQRGFELFESDWLKLFVPLSDFWRSCGSCSIVRRDLFETMGCTEGAADELIRDFLGPHARMIETLADSGFALAELPFAGAVYRRGHANSLSSSGRRVGAFRRKIINRGLYRSPLENLKNLVSIRPVGRRFRSEFMGAPAPGRPAAYVSREPVAE